MYWFVHELLHRQGVTSRWIDRQAGRWAGRLVQRTIFTEKPVWNNHPGCQEKMVFPDKWLFQTGSFCIESSGRQNFSGIRKCSFQTGLSFQMGSFQPDFTVPIWFFRGQQGSVHYIFPTYIHSKFHQIGVRAQIHTGLGNNRWSFDLSDLDIHDGCLKCIYLHSLPGRVPIPNLKLISLSVRKNHPWPRYCISDLFSLSGLGG